MAQEMRSLSREAVVRPPAGEVYAFGPVRVDVARHVVTRDGQPIALAPKTFELLLIFVRSGGRVLSRQDLVAALWPDTFVEEANLSFQISTLRKALGEGAEQWIETVPKVGYRFTADVATEPSPRATLEALNHRQLLQPAVIRVPRPRRRRGVAGLLAGATIALAVVAALAMLERPSSTPAGAAPATFSIPLPDSLDAINAQVWPFPSPDGSHIAVAMTNPMATMRGVWMRPLQAADGSFIEGCKHAYFLEWSPDSSRLICAVPGKSLQVLNLVDGSTRDFCIDCDRTIGKMAWSARGLLLIQRDNALFAVAEAGRPVLVTAPDQSDAEVQRGLPAFLPDGEHFTFMVRSKDPSREGLYLGRLDVAAAAAASRTGTGSGTGRLLAAEHRLQAEIPAVYADEHIIYSQRGDIMARSFDTVRRDFTGPPAVLLPERSWMRGVLGGVIAFGHSETGLFAFSKVEHPHTQFQWIDRAGRHLGALGEPGQHVSFDLSPDGRRLAIATLEDARAGLWVRDVERGSLSRVSFSPFDFDTSPRWLSDNRRMVFARIPRVPSHAGLFVLTENGDMQPLDAPRGCFLEDASRDGRYVLCRTDAIVALSPRGAPAIEVYRPALGHLNKVEVSPDSRWVAFGSTESGRPQVYITRLERGGPRWMVSVDGGLQPRWRVDGRELYYIALDGRLYATGVALSDAGEPVLSRPVPLFDSGLVSPSADIEQYAVTNDGRFLLLLPLEKRIRRSLTVLQNWPAMLREATESRGVTGTSR